MIEVGRNSIVIRNVNIDSSEYKKLNAKFSVYDKAIFKYTMSAFTVIGNDIYFPASVSLASLRYYFPDKKIVYNTQTIAHSANIKINMVHQPRDELQRKAINFLLSMKSDPEWKSRFLSLATGTGKTYVTINFISKIKKRALVIVDTLDLASQWKREIMNHSDVKEDEIRILSGSDSVEKEKKFSDGKIYIAIHRTLGNMLEEDYNAVNVLMNKLKIGIRVFDESHVDFKNICMINSLSNVEYTIFLSATPNRSRFNEDSLYAKVFKNIPYFNGKELYNEKYHTVILCRFNSLPSLEEKLKIKTRYGFNTPRWAKYIEADGYDSFLEAILNIFKKFKLLEMKKKIGIILPTINLIQQLKVSLESNFPGNDIGVFIGDIKKDKRIDELGKNIFITNDKMFEKGIDVQDLEILINCVPFASTVKAEQMIGRLRYGENKKSILIDVTDYGFDECIKQSKLRKRFYKKKAKKIFEFN